MRTDAVTGLQTDTGRDPAADRAAVPVVDRALRRATAATELLLLGVLELVLIDWLWSNTNPYPYAASMATSCAALVGLLALQHRRLRAVGWGALAALAFAIVVCAAAEWTLPARLAGAGLGVATAVAMLSGWRRGVMPAVASVGAVAVTILLWPAIDAAGTAGIWLGNGLGSAGAAPDGLPVAVLGTQWGFCCLALLLGAVWCALAVFAGARRAGTEDDTARPDALRIMLGAAGLTAIGALAVQSRFSASLLTTGSCVGTWALLLSAPALVMASAPDALRITTVGVRWPRRSASRRSAVIAAVALLVLGAAHLALFEVIRPYAGSSSPPRCPDFSPLSQVSQPMQDATVAMEDGAFYHEGAFDFAAMHRALRVDIRAGRVEQGGSTITQQLAKNLFLTKDRTIWRKIQEAALAAELSHALPKRRILELYLNSIDYGYGCRGITQAAAYYFHTTPAKLSLTESAILVGLVPNPPQPDQAALASGEAQYEDLGALAQGAQTALGRIAFFFPGRYSAAELAAAQNAPLDRTIYPYKDAYDRGAVDTIPAVWHKVGFYFFADPNEPSQIDFVSPYLLPELGSFLVDARRRYDLVGIDHLGVYNDRGMRQAHTVISAHAYGQAIDISGFRFADGRNILVADHSDPKALPTILRMEALLRKHFDIVISWQQDPLRHQTHFHCEVRGPRPTEAGPI